ncbi:MAG: hypothetical protein Q9218_007944, partial [Villophora microphyllina]
FLEDSRFADLTVTCQDQEWKCHKIILCNQSDFFDKACSNGFKKPSQESATSVIDLPEDFPLHVGFMIQFFYHGDYGRGGGELLPGATDSDSPNYAPKVHLAMISLGDKYAVPKLSDFAAEQFCDYLLSTGEGRLGDLEELFHFLPDIYESAAGESRIVRDFVWEQLANQAEEIMKGDKKEMLLDLLQSSHNFRDDVCTGWLEASTTRKSNGWDNRWLKRDDYRRVKKLQGYGIKGVSLASRLANRHYDARDSSIYLFALNIIFWKYGALPNLGAPWHFAESVTSMIQLPEDQAYHIALMLEFLYGQSYDLQTNKGIRKTYDTFSPDYILKVHYALFSIGDKYGIANLKEYAASQFSAYVGSIKDVVEIFEYIPHMYEGIGEQQRQLRDVVVKEVIRLSDQTLWQSIKEVMLELMDTVREFREDLCLALVKKNTGAPGRQDNGFYSVPSGVDGW